jgi:hypothetical protein
MTGGNTDSLYKDTDNRKEFAESLVEQHPDVAKVSFKFGRWHHHVDYRSFKSNKLIYKTTPPTKDTPPNNYGMRLVSLEKD